MVPRLASTGAPDTSPDKALLMSADKAQGCPHGPGFIDECGNTCNCVDNMFYGCTLKGCLAGQTSQKPLQCSGADDLPERSGDVLVICHDGIVKSQSPSKPTLPARRPCVLSSVLL